MNSLLSICFSLFLFLHQFLLFLYNPFIFCHAHKNMYFLTRILYIMKIPFEEILIPLILISNTCCIFKLLIFPQMFLSFFFSTSEIPQFRLPYDVVNFEIELMKDLGVKVSEKYNIYVLL